MITYNIKHTKSMYYADTEAEIASWDITGQPMGTLIYAIDTGKLFVLDGSYQWVEIPSEGGGDGGGGGITADEIAMKTISGIVSGSASFISGYAFYSLRSLITASFPVCQTIGASAFTNCTSLTAVSFPVCSYIASHAFKDCRLLTNASFPACLSMSDYVFQQCYSLSTVSFPICSSIGNSAFYSCSRLASASFPVCSFIGSGAFAACTSLTAVSFPACSYIGSRAFDSCHYLESAYFLGSSVPGLSFNAFSATPIGGYSTSLGRYGSVFVRESLYSAFLTARNWSSIASRIVSMTDAEIEALG